MLNRIHMTSMKPTAILLALLITTPVVHSQTLDPEQEKYVKRYEKQPNPPKPAEMLVNTDEEPDLKAGFTPLFNGKDLDGWKPLGGICTYEVSDGAIVGTVVKGSPSTYLSTEKEFSDFIFTCEMKWIVNSNSGIMFRARKKSDKNGRAQVFGPQAEMEARSIGSNSIMYRFIGRSRPGALW